MKFSGLTTWGKNHLASLPSANKSLRLSKVMIGEGEITSKEQAEALLTLVNYKKTYPITNIKDENSVTIIECAMDNIGLQDGITAKEIGIYVDENGTDKLFWYINNYNESTYIYPISGGLLTVNASYQMVFAGSDVTVMNTYGVDYFVSKEFMMEYVKSFAKVHYGTTPPADGDVLWVDQTIPNIGGIPIDDSDLVDVVMKTLRGVKEKLGEIDYKMSQKLDPGVRVPPVEKKRKKRLSMTFSEQASENVKKFLSASGKEMPDLDPSYPTLPDDYTPDIEEYLNATLKHLCIARGTRANMGSLLGGEVYFETDEKALYIGDDKGNVYMLCKVGGGGGGGGGNLTGEYVELVSPKGIAYKIRVTDQGSLEVYKSAIDNRPLPDPDDLDKKGWDTYKASDKTGLCINQIYSGGKLNSEDTPVSHSFIEIYNNSERDISLRGLSVQFSKMGSDWKSCPLDGMLPGNTSFLIRCQQNTNPYKLSCRLKITNYDMEWDQELSNTGMKVALVVGPKPMTIPDPYKDPPRIEPIHRYIDMLSAAGAQPSEKIDYAEGYFARACLDKNTALCRGFVKGLKDRDSSLLDTMSVDYRYASIEHYGPKCRKDGTWDIYRDKIKLSDNRPNMIFVTFGKQQSTRLFTWQTHPTPDGYLKIKKIANTVFKDGNYVKESINGRIPYKTYHSEKRNITHHDTSAVSHKVIVRDLTPGIYLYKAGEEGMWSDEYEIEVFHERYGDFTTPLQPGETEEDREIRFIHTTDQQGWDEFEYKCWKHASDFIVKNEKDTPMETSGRPNYDWKINTGDESQNGNRSFEWRYYYDAAKADLSTTVEMSVAGNNDLVDKKKSEAFTYYTSYEDSPFPSCYEFFIGDVQFLSFHTWAHVDTDYKDIVSIDSDEEDPYSVGFVNKQIKWLKARMKANRKRWTIILTHVAPFTIVKMKNAQIYRDFMEGYNGEYAPADVCICGHNHSYSRSKAMLGVEVIDNEDGTQTTLDKIDPLNGVYHCMSQATGFKLSGKAKPVSGSRWYAIRPDGSEAATVPPHPVYIMWVIKKDCIQMVTYQITGIVHEDGVTREVTYGDPSTFQKEEIDRFTIWHRDKRAEHVDEL